MVKPRIVSIKVDWIDHEGNEHHEEFNENTLEGAETLMGLMDGNITEEDLKG